jgi:hypothetical protein
MVSTDVLIPEKVLAELKSNPAVFDEIYCEAALHGHLIVLKNDDVPGVIGTWGRCWARRTSTLRTMAIAVVSTDVLVPEKVLAELKSNPAVKVARYRPGVIQ